MATYPEQPQRLVLTATLTSGISCVTRGMSESVRLVDQIMRLDHTDWETILLIGDAEYQHPIDGQYPDAQMRVSVQPSTGYAALNYTDNNDPTMAIANSYNPARPLPGVYLLFNGDMGSVFPLTAAIPIDDARRALHEWLRTRQRPTCIEWRPYDHY